MIDRDRGVLQLFPVLSRCWPKCGCLDQQKWSCVMYMQVMITKMISGALIRCISFPRNKWLSWDEKLNGCVRSINHRTIGYLDFLYMINQLFPENSIVSFIVWYPVNFIWYTNVLSIQRPDSQRAGMGINRIEIIDMKCTDIRLTLYRWLSTRL